MSKGEDCVIGFLGHTDTVSYSEGWVTNPFELTEKDGRLYGLGTSDMKGSIAAILAAVSRDEVKNLKKGVKLYFTYDEEIGFSGVNELTAQNTIFPDYMIIGEPTNNEVINASKGLLELRVVFDGISSHASVPEEGVNAIEKCISFLNKLQQYYGEIKQQQLNSKSATMNIGVIKGGRSSNIVPDSCEVIIDFRTILKNQNQEIIAKARVLAGNGAKVEVINSISPFRNQSEDKVNMTDFITEASFIKAKERIVLGVGPVNAHRKNEFIDVASLEKLEKQYIELIKEKCS
jgi:acetylornithine deacetylase